MKSLYLSIMVVLVLLLSVTLTNINLPIAHGISGSAFFMKTNSTAKIYADFTFRALNNETWSLYPQILTSLDVPNTNPSNLIIDATPGSFKGSKSHVNVTYTITSKSDTKGVYALFLYFCGLSPLVVGFNESEVSPALYNKFFTAAYMCPAGSGSMPDMNIIGYSGIVSKTISINSDNASSITTVNQLGELPKSPLKQFKAGIAARDITCKEGLQLIIKSEDESPVCVKPQTADKLVARGWAHGSSDAPIVYFMKSNSIAKISVKYDSAQSGETNLNARIYNSTTMSQIPQTEIGVTVNPSVIPAHSNTIVLYTITSHETRGLFWLSLDACSFLPIAIDLDNSRIANSDLQPPITGMRCPVSFLHYKIVDGLEGITPEYVRVR